MLSHHADSLVLFARIPAICVSLQFYLDSSTPLLHHCAFTQRDVAALQNYSLTFHHSESIIYTVILELSNPMPFPSYFLLLCLALHWVVFMHSNVQHVE